MFGRADTLNGVTENIMCGQLSNIGTGCVDLLLDESRLKDSIEHVHMTEVLLIKTFMKFTI